MVKVKAAKDFKLATSCRNVVEVKKGETVEVEESSIKGMISAGQVEEAEVVEVSTVKQKKKKYGSKFSKKLDDEMTTK